jgi:small subunit ribosomal protein S16
MALKIRLARAGSKKRPYYHVVDRRRAFPARRPLHRAGRATGTRCCPRTRHPRQTLKEDRIKHWLEHGAQPTDRVARFLDEAGMLKREARNNPNKAKPGKKAQERASP